MDQRLGQPLRKIGRPLERPQPRRERNGPRPLRPKSNPHMPPPHLITGPLDDHPPRRKPCTQPLPNPNDLTLVVLPKHIGGPHKHRSLTHRQLKPPVDKRKPFPLKHLGGGHPLGVDLHPHHPHPRRNAPKPPQQLHSSPGRSPIPEINSHSRAGPPQRPAMRSHNPPIHPPQPIRIGGPTSNRTHGTSGTGGGHAHEDMRPPDGPLACATASRGRTGGCPPAAAGVRQRHRTNRQHRPTEDGYPPVRPRPTTKRWRNAHPHNPHGPPQAPPKNNPRTTGNAPTPRTVERPPVMPRQN